MLPLDPNTSVGRIATTHPHAVGVFERHGIDFCCGGTRTLVDACASRGLEVHALIREIGLARDPTSVSEVRWDAAPLSVLVDHVEECYHRPLERDLARLQGLLSKVVAVHGPTHPTQMAALDEAFLALREEVEPHVRKEEEILFPWIRAGRGETAAAAVKVLASEHEAVGGILARIRAITGDYVAPAEACGTWRALWDGLARLERDLHAHIHLENNVLFPRALA